MPIKFFPLLPCSAQWGQIIGNINEQNDLVDELEGKANAEHNHDESYELKNANIQGHIASNDNPHLVTKAQIGLSQFTEETESRTITIPYTYASEQIQAEIDAIGKYIPVGVTITLQFTNTSAKYLNNSSVVDLGDGTVKISCTGHGFVQGDVVSIDGTINYNGDYSLPSQAKGDVDNFVITSNYVAETLTSSAIIRKPQNLDSTLQFSGFYGGGTIIIQGNRSESNAAALHTTQQIYLNAIANQHTLSLMNNQVRFYIYDMKLKINVGSNYAGVWVENSNATINFSYFLGASTSYGYGICFSNSSTGTLQNNYVSNVLYGIGSQMNSLVSTNENDDYGTMPAYGLLSSSSIIFKSSTQPSGSTSNETKFGGGQIF